MSERPGDLSGGFGDQLFRQNCRKKSLLRVGPEQTEGDEEADIGTGNSSRKFRKALQGSNAIVAGKIRSARAFGNSKSDRGPGKDVIVCLKG